MHLPLFSENRWKDMATFDRLEQVYQDIKITLRK